MHVAELSGLALLPAYANTEKGAADIRSSGREYLTTPPETYLLTDTAPINYIVIH